MKDKPFSMWQATKDIEKRIGMEGYFEGGPVPVFQVKEMLVAAYRLGWDDCLKDR